MIENKDNVVLNEELEQVNGGSMLVNSGLHTGLVAETGSVTGAMSDLEQLVAMDVNLNKGVIKLK